MRPLKIGKLMTTNFIVFGSPKISRDEIDEVVDSLQSGWLGTGPKVARFESDFASYKSVSPDKILAVNSCTAALRLSLLGAKVGKGDEVITTAMTFCATVNAIIHSGATPVLVDINPTTLNLDIEAVRKKITNNTKAIVVVHFAGMMCDMKSIMELAQEHNLKVIEDCAHAAESECDMGKAGTIGDFGCFSFYSTKNLVTGEGGMIVAKDKETCAHLKQLALHGMSKDAWHRYSDQGYQHYAVVDCGFKYNMMDLQAALGIHQLKKLDANWQVRQNLWHRYQKAFKNSAFKPINPDIPPGYRHAYHLFCLLVPQTMQLTRDEVLNVLQENQIGAGVHYLSIPEHPFYRETYNMDPNEYPNARDVGRSILSIPFSPWLNEEEIQRIFTVINSLH